MAVPNNSGNQSGDAGIFLVTGFVLVIPIVIWMMAHDTFAAIAVRMIAVEMRVIPQNFWDYHIAATFIANVPAHEMSFRQVSALFSMACRPLVPVAILAFYRWGASFVHENPAGTGRYRRVLSLEDLIVEQAKVWPLILPIVNDNPMRDKAGRWDNADSPERWLQRHGVAFTEEGGCPLNEAGVLLAKYMLPSRVIEQAFDPVFFDMHPDSSFDDIKGQLSSSMKNLLDSNPMDAQGEKEKLAIFIGAHWRIVAAMRPQVEMTGAWTGPMDLPWYLQALFAVFVLKGGQLREESVDLLKRLARLWVQNVIVFRPVARRRRIFGVPIGRKMVSWVNDDPKTEPTRDDEEALKRHRRNSPSWLKEKAKQRARREMVLREKFNTAIGNDKEISRRIKLVLSDKISLLAINPEKDTTRDALNKAAEVGLLSQAMAVCDKHAFVGTAMMNLYDWAKSGGGVLASAEFIWLKPCDRTLWYALNSHGGRVPHIEGAGIFAHWRAEQAYHRPLQDPYVAEAVTGIFDYFNQKETGGG